MAPVPTLRPPDRGPRRPRRSSGYGAAEQFESWQQASRNGTCATTFDTLTGADDVLTTRAVYDASASAYAEAVGTEVTSAFESTIGRAFLTAFAERLEGRAVADVGCGPGRVASFLATRCPDVVGVDVSPAMLQVARTAHPHIRFEQGRLDDLPFPDASLAGVVCWYSVIHTPPEKLDAAFSELARVVAPAGRLLLGFQSGDGASVHRQDAYGSGHPLTSYRHDPEDVARRLRGAAFALHAKGERQPEFAHETTPQTFLLYMRASTRVPCVGRSPNVEAG